MVKEVNPVVKYEAMQEVIQNKDSDIPYCTKVHNKMLEKGKIAEACLHECLKVKSFIVPLTMFTHTGLECARPGIIYI